MEYIRARVLVADGAMATMLMAAGLEAGDSPEEFMLERPGIVREIHRDYVRAEARILTTNTFGASKIGLSRFGLSERSTEICSLAVELAREAADNKAFVAGSVGPIGLSISGKMGKTRIFEAYVEQSLALSNAGVDLIIIETMPDIDEAQLALRAAKSVTDIPIIAHIAFDDGNRIVTDTTAKAAAVSLGSLNPFGIGTNCGGEPAAMVDNVKTMRKYWRGPISAEPSAGIPVERDGLPVWPASPDELAEIALKLHAAGANIIGSCCGSTPEHTSAIAESLRGLEPAKFDISPESLYRSKSNVAAKPKGK